MGTVGRATDDNWSPGATPGYTAPPPPLMTKERDYLINELSKFADLKIYNSQGNFILCEIQSKSLTAKEVREKLIPERIIIRDCVSFDGLDEYFFRVCILKPEENKLLVENLKKIFK